MNLFFDLDGTLLNADKRYYQVYADVLKKAGFQPLDRETYWKHKRTIKSEKNILELSHAESIYEEYYRERTRLMETVEYMQLDAIWPELIPVIPYIAKKHLCSLVTLRMDPEALDWELNKLGIQDAFILVIQPDTGFGTPISPDTKKRILRENFGFNPMKGWIIGDTDVDIITGKALGLFTAAVSYGLQDVSLLRDLGPDKLLSTPKELAIWLMNL
jgi:phosphoglycolate phosphatase-like HAD superfamily hydrolase